MVRSSSLLTACFAVFALASVSVTQAVTPVPVTGDITFIGVVGLDTASAGTANSVTAWGGNAPGNLPQVADRDGSFVGFVVPGDGVTFHVPWSFVSGPIMNFWSVDGFTFDLTSSLVTTRTASGVIVTAQGAISGNNFLTTPGIFRFSTQDPSADAQFSFSASSAAVPEASTISMLLIGACGLAGTRVLRRKRA